MIPKIIHQVWLKGSPHSPPSKLMRTFITHHVGWKYQLWNEDNIRPLLNQKQFDWTKRIDKKADILRYEMLYQFGGIYADVDFVCLKPFDPLLDIPFFAGWQPPPLHSIANGLFGCIPQCSLIGDIIEEISKLTQKQCESRTAFSQTGPGLLTRLWKKTPIGKAHPPEYFYPIHDKDFINGVPPIDWRERSANSYAIHMWGGTFSYDYINTL